MSGALDASPPLTEQLLGELEAKARAAKERADQATPGPWSWWTSCSFRRLSSDPSGKDGDVAYATTHPHDGWPDIAIREEDMVLIAAARSDVPALADAVLQLSAELRARCAMLDEAIPSPEWPTISPPLPVTDGELCHWLLRCGDTRRGKLSLSEVRDVLALLPALLQELVSRRAAESAEQGDT